MTSALTETPKHEELRKRLTDLAAALARVGLDAAILGPGADMNYYVNASIASHERLTCLVVPAAGEPRMLVPALERAGWAGSTAERLGLTFETWADGEDPYRLVAAALAGSPAVVGVDDYLPSMHSLRLRDAIPGSELALVGEVIAQQRMRKTAAESEALLAVGAAIDRVHSRMGEWLRAGRAESDVAADIEAAIVAEGHGGADFVIVASGPNGASPHHGCSERIIEPGDPVVVDIGGPAPNGYNSDCTRTYLVPGAPPPDGFREVYEVVRAAQAAAVAAVRPGVSAESVDAAARAIITDAGYGDHFITRTGHGIGLEVHEHPYIVSGNQLPLEAGMAFSVEPGIYLPGRFGVRIEDIVIVTETGVRRANTTTTDLVVIEPSSAL